MRNHWSFAGVHQPVGVDLSLQLLFVMSVCDGVCVLTISCMSIPPTAQRRKGEVRPCLPKTLLHLCIGSVWLLTLPQCLD